MGENGARCPILAPHQTYYCILAVETLALVPCVVLAAVCLARYDSDSYEAAHPDVSQVVKYQYLIPIIAVESTWIASDVLALLSILLTVPYLLLPHILVCIVGLIASVVFLGPTIEALVRSNVTKWPLAMLTVVLVVFVLVELFFLSVRIASFRALLKKKKVADAAGRHAATGPPHLQDTHAPGDKPAPQEIEKCVISYSRRSTMSISDDRFEAPPRF